MFIEYGVLTGGVVVVASLAYWSMASARRDLSVSVLVFFVGAVGVWVVSCVAGFAGYVAGLAVILCLTLAQAVTPICLTVAPRGTSRSYATLVSLSTIVVSGLAIVAASSTLTVVFSFEVMLFGAVGLLRLTAKAERGVEALTEMYVWSVIGSFALLTAVFMQFVGSSVVSLVSCFLLLGGFAVKVPLWPCASWLLKAHVEASTEFSILLSGYLVKFGVVGLYRCLLLTEASPLVWDAMLVLGWVGVVESTLRLFYQVDLKRFIATLTVLETNWLVLCLATGSNLSVSLGIALVLVHCWTTTTEFYAVEFLYRRYASRSSLVVSGLWWTSPVLSRLVWVVLLVTLGLPGTSIFALKFAFMCGLAATSVSQLALFGVLMLVLAPIAIVRLWVPVLCGQASQSVGVYGATRLEVVILVSCLVAAIVVGFVPSLLCV